MIRRGEYHPASHSRAGALPPDPPWLPRLWGPFAPRRSVARPNSDPGNITPRSDGGNITPRHTLGPGRFPPTPPGFLACGGPSPHAARSPGQTQTRGTSPRDQTGGISPRVTLSGRGASPRPPLASSLVGALRPTPLGRPAKLRPGEHHPAIRRGEYHPASHSRAGALPPDPPWLPRLWGPFAPRRSVGQTQTRGTSPRDQTGGRHTLGPGRFPPTPPGFFACGGPSPHARSPGQTQTRGISPRDQTTERSTNGSFPRHSKEYGQASRLISTS